MDMLIGYFPVFDADNDDERRLDKFACRFNSREYVVHLDCMRKGNDEFIDKPLRAVGA